jgi:hypothetical protein
MLTDDLIRLCSKYVVKLLLRHAVCLRMRTSLYSRAERRERN